MSNELFPKVKKSINDLIDDEEGNIPEENFPFGSEKEEVHRYWYV